MLDVGGWGLEGDNTSQYLEERFSDIIFMNNKPLDKVNLVGDFYGHKFKEKFDLIVLDLNIENNVLKDWSDEGLERVRGLLKKGGTLINYIMTTSDYGDPNETPELIKRRWKEFWGTEDITDGSIGRKLKNIPGYEFFIHIQEEQRSEIIWVVLKKL